MGLSVVIACIGIAIAFVLYVVSPSIPAKFTEAFPALHRAVFNKWYIDELYDFVFVNPCKAFGNFLWKGFDVVVIDGIVDGVAKVVMGISAGIKSLQSGYVHNYALSMALGVVVIVAFYIFR
jgi:NADH-quinone oxidoreductase subunit L